MIHFSYIIYLGSWLLLIISGGMLFPAFIEFCYDGPDGGIFLGFSIGLSFLSALAMLVNRPQVKLPLSIQDAFLLTVLIWIVSVFISSFPFMFGRANLPLADAFFQSASMLTTTGANVIENLENHSPGILFWCSFLQWLGGKGIILMALILMPVLRIGGMQLFNTESSEKNEKFLPRVTQIAYFIFAIYTFLTLICIALLWGVGFNFFEALCHGMSTISTGGFSIWEKPMAHFQDPSVQLVMSFFMFLGGCTFALIASIFQGRPERFFYDSQIMMYTMLLLLVTLGVTLWRSIYHHISPAYIFLETLFNVSSIMTTTGFSSADYMSWGTPALIVMFFLPFLGGCTGSTAGGMKVMRFQILWRVTVAQLRKMRRPHGMFAPTYGGKIISQSVFNSVVGFFVLYLVSFLGLSFFIAFSEVDIITAFSTVGVCLTNAGCGIGDIVGPSGNFSFFDPFSKYVLSLAMIMGRIELIGFFVIFMPTFWKK